MPELPEVETFRRSLLRGHNGTTSILGKVVQRGEVLWDGILVTPSVEDFSKRVEGQSVVDIGRRGKHLLLHLTTDTLIIHPRMSGEILLESQHDPLGKHYRLILHFQDETRFVFNNIRKFGRVWLTHNPGQILSHLGPEPLSDDFTPDSFYTILHERHRQLKYLLLDQRVIAGLGNIYTDEALYLAGIHPRTKSDSLSSAQTFNLWKSIRKVLRKGIENQGTTIDWIYKGGEYQKHLYVYDREGESCRRCGTTITKMNIAQRGTHICPKCQLPPDE